MVDHQKTLYEVMKRGVDSDQKLNHAYATGLLKKISEFFATIILFLFYHVEQNIPNGNQDIEGFSHCSKNLTISTKDFSIEGVFFSGLLLWF